MSASSPDRERVLLGRITGAHGLKGEVKIAAFTAKPQDLAAYGPLMNADGTRSFEIASLHGAGGGTVIARLRGVPDRNAAEALRRVDLFVSRDLLPPAAADEYYYSDLTGLTAVSPNGEILGEIAGVHNFGAGDLLELRPANGGQTEFIPFQSAHAPTVDLAENRITIVRPVYENEESAKPE